MGVSVVSAVHGGGTAGTSFGSAFVAPTAGQLEVVFATVPNAITITAPAGEGWTVAVNVNPDRRQYAAWRIVPSSPTNNAFTVSSSSAAEYCQLLLTGHDPTTPIADAQGTSSATASSSIVAPSATATKSGSLLLNQYMQLATASPGTITPAGGQTTLDSGSVVNGYNCVWTSEVVGSGATGTRTASSTLSQPTGGISLVVNPAIVSLADSGSGADALTATLQVTQTLTETGSGADAVVVSQAIALTDSATGVEAFTVPKIIANLADTAAAAEAIGVTATVPLADARTAVDALGITAHLSVADTATTSDAGRAYQRFTVWDGSRWVETIPKVWNGTAWVVIPVTLTPKVT